jgi:hypothetical protein
LCLHDENNEYPIARLPDRLLAAARRRRGTREAAQEVVVEVKQTDNSARAGRLPQEIMSDILARIST